MKGFRHRSIPFVFLLLASCGQSYQPSNEFSQAMPGASITIEADDADKVDAITEKVQQRLTSDPKIAGRILSHGHATATAYNLRFRGRCADGAAIVAIVRDAAVPLTSAAPRCSDR
jgi:hypothetical protein